MSRRLRGRCVAGAWDHKKPFCVTVTRCRVPWYIKLLTPLCPPPPPPPPPPPSPPPPPPPPPTRAFVDSRVQPIYGGTNEIMKELIARTIVGTK